MKRLLIMCIMLGGQLYGAQGVRYYATSPATRQAAKDLAREYYYSLLTRPGLKPEVGIANRTARDFFQSHAPELPTFFKTAAGAAVASSSLPVGSQEPEITDVYS